MKSIALQTGSPHPEGATVTEDGINFALYAPQADKVKLCLFTDDTEQRFPLTRTDAIWHGFISGLPAAARYGYRVHGQSDEARSVPVNIRYDPRSTT